MQLERKRHLQLRHSSESIRTHPRHFFDSQKHFPCPARNARQHVPGTEWKMARLEFNAARISLVDTGGEA